MRKILIILVMVLFPMAGWAAPFLSCTAVPAGSIDKIELTIDGATPILVDPKTNTDGTLTLWYDLNGVSVANHNFRIRAKKGVWYGGYSTPDPFVFTRPAVPALSNVGLSE